MIKVSIDHHLVAKYPHCVCVTSRLVLLHHHQTLCGSPHSVKPMPLLGPDQTGKDPQHLASNWVTSLCILFLAVVSFGL